ncbi:16S rRNA (guanine(966)-N(2))-methyltransferase RsmD [Oceanobacillus halotolerans]|uniref:16S rRNA (guanine(966)-N(2))-methyltransferase RsmD n=1 Tax=Oceanobacillus halotolerans TaxID=2663380 RepID=UPI0013D9BBDC|nr:16S rRNA (guanine(966)-N(2))-methyltransferase RsmD [Oceanobacillus halotolerans]
MRVISGCLKGHQLKAVPGKTTRPTTDKVKEAVFQMIGPFFDGGTCFDLFSGSGALGIEALSRGMDKCLFVDKHPKAIHIIYENLRMLKIENKAEVFRAEAYRAIKAAAKRNIQFELILLDPPYKQVDYGKLLNEIKKHNLLHDNGLVYCEHDTSEQMPKNHDYVRLIKQEDYGSTIGVTLYKKREGSNPIE